MNEIELAGALILNSEKKLLLIHRNSIDRVQWELPGGKVEKYEKPIDTAIRELKEELDIKINIEKYLGYNISLEDELLLRYHLFLASIIEGVPFLNEDKFDNINYFTKSELLKKDDLSSNMKTLIKKIDINIID